MCFTFKPWSTEALSNVADGIGSTLDVTAEVALDGFVFHRAQLEGVSDVPALAPAVVGSRGVDADGMEAADGGGTLVDIQAAGVGIAGVPFRAHALWFPTSHRALGVGAAGESGARLLSWGRTPGQGAAHKSEVASAPVRSAILAVGVGSAAG